MKPGVVIQEAYFWTDKLKFRRNTLCIARIFNAVRQKIGPWELVCVSSMLPLGGERLGVREHDTQHLP